MFMDRMLGGRKRAVWVWMLAICVLANVRQKVGALARALCKSRFEIEAWWMVVRLRSCFTPLCSQYCSCALEMYPLVLSQCTRLRRTKVSDPVLAMCAAGRSLVGAECGPDESR